jgi:hypothetical protein
LMVPKLHDSGLLLRYQRFFLSSVSCWRRWKAGMVERPEMVEGPVK